MSVVGPTRARFPPACSGAMSPGVPTRIPLCVIVWPPSIIWARPKSVIFGQKSGVRIRESEGGANSCLQTPDSGPLKQDVGRLQVAVDDPFAVRHVNGTGQGLDE